jgi:uncharacterized protein YbjT (DUF2867 family)
MSADDVAGGMARVAVGPPANGIVEIGGPEQFRLDELVRKAFVAWKDPREVIADPHARYYGTTVSEKTLIPGNDARLGETTFETWLTQSAAQIPSAHGQRTGTTGTTTNETNGKQVRKKAS